MTQQIQRHQNPGGVTVDIIANVPPADPLVVSDEADNCSVPTVVFVSDVSDGNSCPETITRTYSVTDACGNQILVTQIIIVSDMIMPTASNPAGMNVECIAQVPAVDPLVVTDEADNNGVPVVAFVSDVSDGNTCPETITRTYSVTDPCGNQILVTQIITVNDITPPTASNPAGVTVQCISQVPASNILIVNDEADNCTVNPVVAFVGDLSDGNTCPETITRTYSVTENRAICRERKSIRHLRPFNSHEKFRRACYGDQAHNLSFRGKTPSLKQRSTANCSGAHWRRRFAAPIAKRPTHCKPAIRIPPR